MCPSLSMAPTWPNCNLGHDRATDRGRHGAKALLAHIRPNSGERSARPGAGLAQNEAFIHSGWHRVPVLPKPATQPFILKAVHVLRVRQSKAADAAPVFQPSIRKQQALLYERSMHALKSLSRQQQSQVQRLMRHDSAQTRD